MNNTLENPSTKNECYEKNKKHLNNQARNGFHKECGKEKAN